MATHQEPCNVCGCRVYDLHDGFFYCTECGTQDVGAQETLFVYNLKEDGTTYLGKKQKIQKKFKTPQERMPNQWYRWHTLNFIMFNTADELIAIGANPSFKQKLFWIWTKYLRAYVKKSHLGLSEIEDILQPEDNSDSDTTDSDEDKYHNILNRYQKSRFRQIELHHTSVLAMIYIALNIDRSHIQISHLLRYIREVRISYPNRIDNIVPKELLINQKTLKYAQDDYSQRNIRTRAMTLCYKLNLGCPVVPDLRLIVEEHIQELCLPNDFKQLVFSLMEYKPCDFLDIPVLEKDVSRIPHYELHCMTYILWGLKLCFGLDCDYELKLSKAVDKINEQEKYPRAYFNSPPNSTERLFSFREWCAYIQFRRKILYKHCRYFRDKAGLLNIDGYVAVEQFENVRENESKNLTDQIATEITQKIPGGNPPYGIIPESEFKPCTTPYSTYARIIAEHLQDTDVKLALSEDFTQYSMKYITEDLYLVDLDNEEQTNLVSGITADNKNVLETYMEPYKNQNNQISKKLVYVKDCDNHNWTTTNPPKADHLIKFESLDTDKVNTGKDGNIDSKICQNDDKIFNRTLDDEDDRFETIEDNSIKSDSLKYNDVKKIEKKDHVNYTHHEQDHLETITEESDNVNIFDDDFITLKETKIEIPDKDIEQLNNNVSFELNFTKEEPVEEDVLSTSSLDSLDFNPSTFDRERIIKELVLMKCKKYKIPIPPRYKPHLVRTYNRRYRFFKQKRSIMANENRKGVLEEILEKYYANAKLDPLQQIENDVLNIMNDINKTKQDMEVNELFDTSINANNISETLPEPENVNNISSKLDLEEEVTKTTGSCTEDESGSDDNLFNESSEGETYGAEFIPPKNPKYDEEKYNKKQLYLKIKKPKVPDMELDDKLSHIIETKMEKDAKDPSLLEWKRERVRTKSESDDDIPLSEIRKQHEIYEKIRQQRKMVLPTFFEGKSVKNYKCWFNFYASNVYRPGVLKRTGRTELEVYIHFPKSFKFVIETCASIIDSDIGDLISTLENCEQFALSKCKIKIRKKRNVQFILDI